MLLNFSVTQFLYLHNESDDFISFKILFWWLNECMQAREIEQCLTQDNWWVFVVMILIMIMTDLMKCILLEIGEYCTERNIERKVILIVENFTSWDAYDECIHMPTPKIPILLFFATVTLWNSHNNWGTRRFKSVFRIHSDQLKMI